MIRRSRTNSTPIGILIELLSVFTLKLRLNNLSNPRVSPDDHYNSDGCVKRSHHTARIKVVLLKDQKGQPSQLYPSQFRWVLLCPIIIVELRSLQRIRKPLSADYITYTLGCSLTFRCNNNCNPIVSGPDGFALLVARFFVKDQVCIHD